MKNVFVSTKEGVSLCIDKENKKVCWFLTGRSMSSVDVARHIGTSRANVGQTLRRSMKKVFFCLRKLHRDLDPFEVAVVMSELFGVSSDCDEEVEKFIKLFPEPIKREIKNYAGRHL
jgi:hypothetical protein